MIRSVLAVASGFLAWLVLLIVMLLLAGIIFPASVPQRETVPSIGWVAFYLLYGILAAAAGGYVTAIIAVNLRPQHTQALAFTIMILCLLNLAANFDKQPIWYLGAQVIVSVLGVFVGGNIGARYARRIARAGK